MSTGFKGGPNAVAPARPGKSPDAVSGRPAGAPADNRAPSGGTHQSADKLQFSLGIVESRSGGGRQNSRRDDCEP